MAHLEVESVAEVFGEVRHFIGIYITYKGIYITHLEVESVAEVFGEVRHFDDPEAALGEGSSCSEALGCVDTHLHSQATGVLQGRGQHTHTPTVRLL